MTSSTPASRGSPTWSARRSREPLAGAWIVAGIAPASSRHLEKFRDCHARFRRVRGLVWCRTNRAGLVHRVIFQISSRDLGDARA